MYVPHLLYPFICRWTLRFKQQTFISHGPGGWEHQDQDAGKFSVQQRPTSWFADGYFLAHTVKRDHLSCVASYKATNPIHEGSTLMTKFPPKGSTSRYHHIVD